MGEAKSHSDGFIGWSTVYGWDGGVRSPYMTRAWIGRLYLHVFHRGDADPDPHDHPWDFWTFPLTSYVEEVTRDISNSALSVGPDRTTPIWSQRRQVVRAWRLSFRPATHTHRVLGRFDGYDNPDGYPGLAVKPGKIVTIVWKGPKKRPWGFLKNHEGKWCWIAWRDYVFGSEKDTPC